MKSIFSICKIFLFCFFVLYTFSSCSSDLDINGKKVPKKVTIHVTGYDTLTGRLKLYDDSNQPADTFIAYPGQEIRWKLTEPRKHAILHLTAKTISKFTEDTIFSTPPKQKFWSKSWKAIIKNDPAIKSLAGTDSVVNYDYKIVWDSASVPHTYDPRIQIRF